MQNADLWTALNGALLDVAPPLALFALAVSWFLRKRRLDGEKKALLDRIQAYREEMALKAGQKEQL